jgi:hypothetical protein
LTLGPLVLPFPHAITGGLLVVTGVVMLRKRWIARGKHGVALAIHLLMPPPDRAVIGGLLIPVLWGAGMAWMLCDPRVVRATLILLVVLALGYGITFMPKVLA